MTLPNDERLALILRWQKHRDESARTRLLKEHTALVHFIIRRYFKPYVENSYEDMVQDGAMGLVRAIDRYDPSRGATFLTVAGFTIRGSIACGTVATDDGVRFRFGGGIKKLWNAKKLIDAGNPVAAVANSMHMREETILGWMATKANRAASMDAPIGEDDGLTLHDLVAGETPEQHLLEQAETSERNAQVRRALDKLKPSDRTIIEERYCNDKTLNEIGDPMDLSRERIRQLETRALERFKIHAAVEGLTSKEQAGEWVTAKDASALGASGVWLRKRVERGRIRTRTDRHRTLFHCGDIEAQKETLPVEVAMEANGLISAEDAAQMFGTTKAALKQRCLSNGIKNRGAGRGHPAQYDKTAIEQLYSTKRAPKKYRARPEPPSAPETKKPLGSVELLSALEACLAHNILDAALIIARKLRETLT